MKKLYLISLMFLAFSSLRANEYVDDSITNFPDLPKSRSEIFNLYSHGKPGYLYIEGKWRDANQIATWLNGRVDFRGAKQLNIYGCSFAQGDVGKKSITYLEKELHISVAASDDPTGVDGDWILEIGRARGTLAILTYKGTLQCAGTNGGVEPTDDRDGDGICNSADLDDDNDGILDIDEYACGTDISVSKPIDITSDLSVNSGTLSELMNGVETNDIYFGGGTSIVAKTVFQFEYANPAVMKTFWVGTTASNIFSTGTKYVIQASNDGTTWENVSDTVTTTSTLTTNPYNAANYINTFDISSNTAAYTYYRIYGISGSTTNVAGAWLTEAHFNGCLESDPDGDGIANPYDLDSDGDGCSDSFETSVPNATDSTSTTVYHTNATDANTDGVDDAYYTAGAYTYYISLYQKYALSNAINICKDLDGDGKSDLIDVDDDNDGILDADESPSCFYTEANALKVASVTTGLATTSAGPIILSYDGSTSTSSSFTTGQSIVNKTIYEVTPVAIPIAIASMTIDKSTAISTNASSTFKLQGFDGTSWVDLSPAISNTLTTDLVVSNTLQPNVSYYGYRIQGVAGTGSTATTQEITLTGASGYVPSLHPVASCTVDTDGDGMYDHQDLDADGDGCNDSFESAVLGYTSGTNDSTYHANATDANNDGIDDAYYASGVYTYTSTYSLYAQVAGLNACSDTDGDGKKDLVDVDDDNDGILDATESSSCYYSASEASALTATASDITWSTTYPYTNATDGNITTLTQADPLTQAITSKVIMEFTSPTALPVTSLNLDMGAFQLSTSAASGSMKLQGWNGSAWVDLSAAKTSTVVNTVETFTNTLQPSGVFSKVRLYGVSGTLYYARIDEASLVVPSTYQPSLYPKAICTEDIDGDGIVNQQDLDSDGDGCNDSYESSVPGYTSGANDSTYHANATDANADGMDDAYYTASNYTFTPTYDGYAASKFRSACIDSDGDGIKDLTDLDDDNDGILDAVESSSCFYSAAEANVITDVASDFASPDAFTNLYDGVGTDVFNFSAGTAAVGSNLFTVTYPDAVKLTSVTLSDNITTTVGGTADLYGSIDGITWVKLTSVAQGIVTATGTTFTVNQNAGNYKYYKIQTAAPAGGITLAAGEVIGEISSIVSSGYEPSSRPKFSCEEDTDGDGILNHLDLDSDGDGCNDSYESGVPGYTSGTDLTTIHTNATDANADGVDDSYYLNFAPTFKSAYESYAVYKVLNTCSDLDGDGLKDLVDLDDDNDGILDVTESYSCFYTEAEAGVIATITSGLTSPDDDQTDGDIALLHDGSTTATYNFTPSQVVTTNDVLYNITYKTPVELSKVVLSNQIGTSTANAPTADLWGSLDGVTWVKLMASPINTYTPTTNITFNVTQNSSSYLYYQVRAASSVTLSATAYSVGEITTTIKTGSYVQGLHPKPTCLADIDNDGIPNHQDLDSDGDLCNDSYEAGVTGYTSGADITTYHTNATDATNDGIDDVYYTAGAYTYTSTYTNYAVNETYNKCTEKDTDGDGLTNLQDVDDDNDGILDADESPTCFYSFAEATSIAKIKSQFTSADDSQTDGDIQLLHNGSTTATFNFNNGQVANPGDVLFEISYPTSVQATGFTLSKNISNTAATDPKAELWGSSDGITYFPLSTAPVATYTPTTNISIPVQQNAGSYKYYQIRAAQKATLSSAYSTLGEITGTVSVGAYIPSLNPKATCSEDTDGDGIPNHQDLDSDGDGCYDSFEAGVTGYTTSVEDTSSYRTNAVDANADGIDDNLYTAGAYTYANTYSIYANNDGYNACSDFDFDGIKDLADLDDDNDGILDDDESPACFFTADEASVLTATASDLTWNTSYPYTRSTDGDYNTWTQVDPGYQTITGKTIIEYTAPTLVPITSLNLQMYNYSISRSGSSGSMKLQGWDGSKWVDLSAAKFATKVNGVETFTNTLQPNGLFSKVRLYGVSGQTYYVRIREASLAIPTTYIASKYPKPSCDNDIDGDGYPNHQDLDSDGDGCNDSFESNVPGYDAGTELFVSHTNATDANLDGVDDAYYTASAYTYSLNYNEFAIYKTLSLCADTDGDGFADLADVDADNDGILNVDEAPSCFYTKAEASVIKTITSGFTSPDDTQADGDIQVLHDGSSALVFNFTNGQLVTAGDDLFTVAYPTQIQVNSITVIRPIGNSAANAPTADLWGSVDGLNWVKLTSATQATTTTPITFTVNQNAGAYKYYQIRAESTATLSSSYTISGITGVVNTTAAYDANLHPKTSCGEDKDKDGIFDYLDLDSDGDGCSDSYEASVPGYTTGINTTTYHTNTADADNNGIDDSYYFSAAYTYTSTYNTYANSAASNKCNDIDTDGDGIKDYVDIDDDNDGVLDSDESPSCFYTLSEAITVKSVTSEFTINKDNQLDYDVQLLHDSKSTTYSTFVNGQKVVTGDTLYTVSYNTPMPISKLTLANRIGASSTDAPSVSLWGSSDGETFVKLTTTNVATTTTPVTLTVGQNSGTYQFYQVRAESAATLSSSYGQGEITPTPITTGYVQILHPKASCAADIDGDGIYNHLDTDSDGDGCNDSFESQVPGITDGSSLAYNTISPDANLDGIDDDWYFNGVYPYVSAWGTYASSASVSLCSDYDGDGVKDYVDLDDDNDGILDKDESIPIVCSGNLDVTAASTATKTATFSNTSTPQFDVKFDILSPSTTLNGLTANGDKLYASTFMGVKDPKYQYTLTKLNESGLAEITFDPRATSFGLRTNINSFKLSFDPNLFEAFVEDHNGYFTSKYGLSSTDPISSDFLYSFGTYDATLSNPATIKLRSKRVLAAGESTQFVFSPQANIVMAYEGFDTKISDCIGGDKDTDSDGIVDQLDLDSDGDGCPDALEGGGTFVGSDLVASTMNGGNDGINYTGTYPDSISHTLTITGVDANGIPNVITNKATGQGLGTSLDGSKQSLACCSFLTTPGTPTRDDSDGDGYRDTQCDIDDDNDGIIDTNEGYCNSSLSIDYTFASDNQSWSVVDKVGTVAVKHNTNLLCDLVTNSLGASPSGDGYIAFMDRSSGSTAFVSPTFESKDISHLLGGTISFDWANGRPDGGGTQGISAIDFIIYNGTTSVKYSVPVSGLANTGWQSFDIPLDVASFGAGLPDVLAGVTKIEISVETVLGSNYNAGCVSTREYFAIDEIQFQCPANADMDKDGIANYLDLDTDGDGCSDAKEGADGLSIIQTSAMPGGNTGSTYNGVYPLGVQLNLTTTAVNDTTGVPDVVNKTTGQAVGTSQTVGPDADGDGVASTCDICPIGDDSLDYDADLIPDACDLDDDNDGILDTVEGLTTDTDGDGTPNYRDLDSDNDGCMDAIEGGATVFKGSLLADSSLCASSACVDTVGVPTLIGVAGQSIGSSQNAAVEDPDCFGTPDYKVVKSYTAMSGNTAGSTISYKIVVKNTGNVVLTNIAITDTTATIIGTNPIATLAVGDSVTLTATQILTQADITAGKIVNVATAMAKDPSGAVHPRISDSGTNPSGTTVNPDSTDTDGNGTKINDPTITNIPSTPSYSLVKSYTSKTGVAVGDTLTYKIVVKNTGNVALANVTITDSTATLTGTNPIATLAVGDSAILTAKQAITQADLDAGKLTNVATATAKDPSGTSIPKISDSGTNTSGIPVSPDSTDTDGDSTKTEDPTITIVPQTPLLKLVKSQTNTVTAVGDTLQYDIVVTNSGNVTMTNVTVTDANAVIVSGSPIATLAPTATATVKAYHIITQTDMNAGKVSNMAIVSGTSPNNTVVKDTSDTGTDTGGGTITNPSGTDSDGDGISGNDPTLTLLSPTPQYTLVKSYVSRSGALLAAVGDTVTYNIVVKNTGNVTLTNILVKDTLTTLTGTNPIASLLPEDSTTLTAVKIVTQADLDAGKIINVATATATDPTGLVIPKVSDSGTNTTGNAVPPATTDTDGNGNPANDPTVTTLPPNSKIKLVKSQANAVSAVGDTLKYNLAVSNIGNVTLTNVTVTDANAIVAQPDTIASLAPGANYIFTAYHVLTQSDIDAGSYTNAAVTSGTDPLNVVVKDTSDTGTDPTGTTITTPDGADSDGDGSTGNDPTVTTFTPNVAYTLVKSYSSKTGGAVGDTVTYNVVLKNTGNVTLSNVTVADSGVVSLTGTNPVASLAPGDSVILIAKQVIKQADLDAGKLTNVAMATATDPTGTTIPKISDSGSNTTGNPTDPTTDTDGDGIPTQDPTITNLAPVSSIKLLKSQTNTVAAVGDTLKYDIVVTNTGNVTLTQVTVTDSNATVISGSPVATLAPGATATVKAIRIVKQADMDAGGVKNIAIVTAKNPSNTDVTDSSDTGTDTGGNTITNPDNTDNSGDGTTGNDPTVTTLTPNPLYTIVKSYTSKTGVTAGDTVTYQVVVKNIGNVTLTNLTLTDTTATLTGTNPIATLAVGDSVTLTAKQVITQTDLDSGKITNVVTGTAKDPSGTVINKKSDSGTNTNGNTVDPSTTDTNGDGLPAQDPTITLLAPNPKVELLKSQLNTISAKGDTLKYSLTITNTGNVTLNEFTLTDANVALVPTFATTVSLAPGASTTVQIYHLVTQADIDAGKITNTAAVSAHDPSHTIVSDTSDTGTGTNGTTVTTPNIVDSDGDGTTGDDPTLTVINRTPQYTLVKSYSTKTGSAAGDTITYNIVVKNTGNVTLTNVVVADSGTISLTGTNPILSLAPGDSTTLVAKQIITQADVDAGKVTNVAAATATDPTGLIIPKVSDSGSNTTGNPADPTTDTDGDGVTPNDPTITNLTPNGSIKLVKNQTNTVAVKGDTLQYDLTATNTGNVTLTNVTVTDANAIIIEPDTIATLAPGGVYVFKAYHIVTQADLDAGYVQNIATVTGKDPSNTAVMDSSDTGTDKTGTTITSPDNTDSDGDSKTGNDPTLTTLTPNPLYSLVKTYTSKTGTVVGATVTYQVVVKNTGNVTLTNLTLTDTSATLTGTNPIASLAPGDSVILTATQTITQANIDSGKVINVVIATAKDPSGNTIPKVSDSGSNTSGNPVDPNTDTNGDGIPDGDPTITTLTPVPAFKVIKSQTNTVAVVGDTLKYDLVVTNTGNVTLSNILVSDANATITSSNPIVTLAPAVSVTLQAYHLVTQLDIEAGKVTNIATGTGKDPSGTMVTDSSDTGTDTGGTVVTNPDGTDNSGDGITGNDPTVATIAQSPSLAVIKSQTNTVSAVGDTLQYDIKVSNMGNVTVVNTVVTDAKATIISGSPILNLPIGSSTIVKAIHILTQADVDAGTYTNIAIATGKSPTGTTVSDSSDTGTDPSGNTVANPDSTNSDSTGTAGNDPTVTNITPNPMLTTIKSLTASGTAVGDTLKYDIKVTNTGNVTITNIAVMDASAIIVSGSPIASLAVGGVATAKAIHIITQADLDAGSYKNTAIATGKSPSGTTVSDTSDTGTDPSGNTVVNPDSTNSDSTGTAGSDPTVTNLTSNPMLTVIKSQVSSVSAVGDTLKYNIKVSNTGNVTVNNIMVTDANAIITSGNPIVTLLPGSNMILEAYHIITQVDMNVGSVKNTALVNGTYNNTAVTDSSDTGTDTVGNIVTDPNNTDNDGNGTAGNDPTLTELSPISALTVIKSQTSTVVTVGDTLKYDIKVTNTGNVTIDSIVVTDAKATIISGSPIASLAPGANVILKAYHVITQTDINAGSYTNIAVASGKNPSGTTVTDSSDTGTDPSGGTVANPDSTNSDGIGTAGNDPTVTNFSPNPMLTTIKAVTQMGSSVGDVLNYDITVTNTGNVTISNIVVSDASATITSGSPITSLVPGASAIVKASHILTQADVDAGKYINTAIATGKDPNNNVVTDSSDTATDPSGNTVSNPDSTNSDGTGTAGNDPTVTNITPNPMLKTIKSLTLSGSAVGDTLKYAIKVTNIGNVTVTNIGVTDAKAIVSSGSPIASLAPGATATATAYHILTQADIDAGSYTNIAIASGSSPSGTTVSDSSDTGTDPSGNTVANPDSTNSDGIGTAGDDPTVTNLTPNPMLTTVKSLTASGTAVGDTLKYDIKVTNTGNVTIDSIVVTDASAIVVSGSPIASLAVGGVATAKAIHIITQADIDAGSYKNTAIATGKDPSNNVVTDSSDTGTDTGGNPVANPDSTNSDGIGTLGNDPTVTTITQSPMLTVIKSQISASIAAVGDTLKYAIKVSNIGNVTVNNIMVTDANAIITSGNPIITLPPGSNIVLEAYHIITQEDMNTGSVANTAIATGKDPSNNVVTDSSDTGTDTIGNTVPNPDGTNSDGKGDAGDDPTVTNLTPNPMLTTVKSLTASGTAVGDTLKYDIKVTNTGNVTIDSIVVTDASAIVVSGSPIASLAVGGVATAKAIHIITQADIDAGSYKNTAIATGTDPSNKVVSDSSDTGTDPSGGTVANPDTTNSDGIGTAGDDPTVTNLTPNPMLTTVKSLTASGTAVGDTLKYDIKVTNTGNVTIDSIVVTDASAIVVSGSPIASLAVGGVATAKAIHIITQADIDAGSYKNTAIATGTDPSNKVVSDSSDTGTDPSGGTVANPDTTNSDGIGTAGDDPTVTNLTPNPMLTTVKSLTASGTAVGDTLKYDIKVTNTGNVTIDSIVVTDASAIVVSGSPIASLAVGGVATAKAIHIITQADIDAGSYKNTAIATGTDPSNKVVSDSSDTGTDPSGGTVANPDTTNSDGIGTAGDDPTVTNLTPNPMLTTVKSLTASGTAVGDTLKYDIKVTNTGNVTIDSIVVTDASAIVVSGSPIASLAVGGVATAKAIHIITQADIDAGSYKNTAIATGTDPSNKVVSDSSDTGTDPSGGTVANPDTTNSDGIGTAGDDPTVTNLTPNPMLTTVKSLTASGTAVGDTLKYDIKVTNTGNVTIDSIVVTDASAIVVSGSPIASLAVGGVATAKAIHIITQADIDAGSYKNTAIATGTDPSNKVVSDSSDTGTDPSGGTVANPDTTNSDGIGTAGDDPTVTNLTPNPMLTTVKSLTASGTAVGDTLKYDIKVTNTGNVTIDSIVVTDASAIVVSGSPIASLAVGGVATAKAIHIITQADIDAGSYKNTAIATGTDPSNKVVSDSSDTGTDPSGGTVANPDTTNSDGIGTAGDDPTVTNLTPNPMLTTVKSLTASGTAVGDTLKYDIKVTNTGNVTIDSIVVTDASAIVVSGSPIASLAVGGVATAKAIHIITQADIDAGSYKNTAIATGTDPSNKVVSDSSDTGTDPSGGTVANPDTTNSDGIGTAGDDPTVTNLTPNPMLTTVKSLTASGTAVGDTLKYDIKVTNTGNVTIDSIVVTDASAIVVSGSPIASLAVGGVATAKAIHIITQADIDAGSYKNTAIATGTDPSNKVVSDSSDTGTDPSGGTVANPDTTNSDGIGTAGDDPTVTNLTPNPMLTTVKSLTASSGSVVGDTLKYNIKVANTGNVTITNIVVTDASAIVSSGSPILNLPVGSSAIVKAYHIITQADLDAGKYTNIALASGKSPSGTTVTDSSDAGTNPSGNPIATPDTTDSDGDGTPGNDPTVTNLPLSKVALLPKVFLQGAMFIRANGTATTTLMSDDIRRAGLLPTTEPYTALGYSPITATGTATINTSTSLNSLDAIVDWVFVSLRSASDSKTIVDSRAALLQRDGDIVELDGVSNLTFSSATVGSYYVSVEHRNHLGVMTANPIALSSAVTTVDFRTADSTFAYKRNTTVNSVPQVSLASGYKALWSGNASGRQASNNVIFKGTGSDVIVIGGYILNHASNIYENAAYVDIAYRLTDINMDAKTIYKGTDNDPNYIGVNVLIVHPGNVFVLQNYLIQEQLP